MQDSISFQPIPILIDGHDTEARLVLFKGQLVAVLVRLDGEAHPPGERGKWHLETGFGPCSCQAAPLFGDLDGAKAWVVERLKAGEFL